MKWSRVLAGAGVLGFGAAWLSGGGVSTHVPHAVRSPSAPLAESAGKGGGGLPDRVTSARLPHELGGRLEAPDTDPKGRIAARVAALDSGDPDARLLGIHLLHGQAEPAGFDALGRALQDPEADIRWAAFRVVTDMAFRGYEAPEITSLLEQALSDPDPALRSEAVDALAQRGAEGLRVTERALADPAEEVQERAAALLAAGPD